MKLSLALLVGLLGAAASATATPVLYTLNFTGVGVHPTGGFTYDAATNTFSDLTVIVDGDSFDFGSAGSCLVDGTCGPMTWMDNISNVPGNPQNGFHTDFLFLLGEELGGVYPGNTTSLGLFGSGTFTVSPEPSTVTLLLAGAGALLGWKLRGRSIKLG